MSVFQRTPPCAVPRGATLETSVACGQPAVRIVSSECGHGHQSTNVVCNEHADLILNPAKTMLCQPCMAIYGHRCPRVAREETR